MLIKDIERGLLIATGLLILDLVIGFIINIINPLILASSTAGGIAFLEVGIALIVGGCLMARQPLDNKDRYTDSGEDTPAWRMAKLGRVILVTGAILFLYTAIIALAGLYSIF
ncbi:MAG: hypothetical protein JW779_06225 [Candidatus Thorarchaeota archaeon]|nr:hypothetical protein [Candidatus Thorarchaeota archaeon]